MLLWFLIAAWVSVDPTQTWAYGGYLFLGISLFDITTSSETLRKDPARLLWFFILVEVGLSLLGPILMSDQSGMNVLGINTFFPHSFSSSMEVINPNVLSGALAALIPLNISLLVGEDIFLQRYKRLLLLFILLIMVGVLILTLSRGAIAAVAVATFSIYLFREAKSAVVVPLVILSMGLVLLWYEPSILNPLLFDHTTIGGIDQRLEIWNRALLAIYDFPLTGIGFGMFSQIIPKFYPYIDVMAYHEIPHAHNLFLQICVDLGIPGLIIYLSMVMNAIAMLCYSLKIQSDTYYRSLVIGLFASLIATITHGMFDATTWSNKLSFLPWLLFAQITLIFLHLHNKEQNSKHIHS